MKKIISLILVAIMIMSFQLPILATSIGTGSESDPYLLYTANDVVNIKNDLSAHYKLMANIDMSEIKDFVPIGNESSGAFVGTIDGNNKTISNLTINTPNEKYTGFIGYNEGVIKNLTLKDINVTGNRYTGGLCGYSASTATVKSCTVSGSVQCNDKYVIALYLGGLIGYNSGTVLDLHNEADVTYENIAGGDTYFDVYVGGVIGLNAKENEIVGFSNKGSVTISGIDDNRYQPQNPYNFYAAGIVASSKSPIIVQNTINYGKIECYADAFANINQYASGLVTECSNSTFNNCYNYGEIYLYGSNYHSYGGGISCLSDNMTCFDACTNYADLTLEEWEASVSLVGIGRAANIVADCINYGDLDGYSDIYGIVRSAKEVKNCTNYGNSSTPNLYGTSIYRAGIAYSADLTENCTNYGSFTTGIIGVMWSGSEINNCSSYGSSVLVGQIGANIKISNSFNIGHDLIMASTRGVSEFTIENCYVVGPFDYSFFPGINTYKYYELFNDKTNFDLNDFDFENTWDLNENINNGLPTLKCFSNQLKLNCVAKVMDIGESFDLNVYDNDGKHISEGIVWESSNPEAISVDNFGKVKSKTYGDAYIYAEIKGVKTSCHIIVPEYLVVNSKSTNINKSLFCYYGNNFNNLLYVLNDVPNVTCTYNSSYNVHQLQRNVYVSFSVPGKQIIEILGDGYKIYSCEVNVTNYSTSISIPSSYKVARGKTEQLQLTNSPSGNESKMIWSSSDSSVVKVDQNGNITGISVGEATITVSSDNGLTDSCVVTVNAPVEKIELPKTLYTMVKGTTLSIKPSVLPIDTTEKVYYSYSGSSYISVDSDGLVTAKKAGSAVVTIYSGSVSIKCSIVVVDGPIYPDSITLNYNSLTLQKGDSKDLIASVEPEVITSEDHTWSSSDEDVVTVDETGKITAKNPGVATVTYTHIESGMTATCEVTVEQLITNIIISETNITLKGKDTYQLVATVMPESATNKVIRWTSSDESIATVNNEGLVTAHKKGSATIVATAMDGSEVYGACNVVVDTNVYIIDDGLNFESGHTYENNSKDYWIYSTEDVEGIDVTFNANTNVEADKDFINIYDAEGMLIGSYTGNELANKTIYVPGNQVKLELVTDDSGVSWGFKVDSIQAHSHNYSSTVQNATCTSNGYTTYVCVSCNDSYVGDETSALGHTEVIDDAITATCTSTGLSEGKHCDVCGEVIVAQTITEKLSHNYTSIVTAATCTESGFTTHTCLGCNDSYINNEIAAFGHQDANNDYNCDNGCGYMYEKTDEPNVSDKPEDNCSCNCHGNFFQKLIFKITNFFASIFDKSKKICACGVKH